MRRIIVIGTPGSGKTTHARELSRHLCIPHIEADSIFHQPEWKELEHDLFRKTFDDLTREDDWVIDGNYLRFLYDLVWPRADMIVWLDYHFIRVVWQVARRTFGRLIHHTELWNGNRETWRMAFSRRSIILWSINMHYVYRKRFERLLSEDPIRTKTIVHLKSPNEAKAWLESIGQEQLVTAAN